MNIDIIILIILIIGITIIIMIQLKNNPQQRIRYLPTFLPSFHRRHRRIRSFAHHS